MGKKAGDGDIVGPGKAPCGSCPYRKDVPSGVWTADEYAKLPAYDGAPFDQVMKGGLNLFLCHQQDGRLCAGWVGCHNPPEKESMALRLHAREVTPETFSYVSPIPLFGSGTEAAAHGMAKIEEPDERAQKVIKKLVRKFPAIKKG